MSRFFTWLGSAFTRLGIMIWLAGKWTVRWTYYSLWLLKEVFRASWAIAFDVSHHHSKISPAILRLPLGSMSDAEVTILATSITLTPGSMVIAIDRGSHTPDSKVDGVACSGGDGYLLVHLVYAADTEEERRALHDMQFRVMTASRGSIGARRWWERSFPTASSTASAKEDQS